MPQLSDFQHELIVVLRKEHAIRGEHKCRKVLPVFYGNITTDQYRGIAAAFNASIELGEVKTDISDDDLLMEITDRRSRSSPMAQYRGTAKLNFVLLRYTAGQEGLLQYRRKTVHRVIYREMCPQMIEVIEQVIHGESWIWQQHGAKVHTANDTVA